MKPGTREQACELARAIVSKNRRAMNVPEAPAMLDGVAKRRFFALLEDGCVYSAGPEKVVQHQEHSLVCVVAGEEVYPVAINTGRKLEMCVRTKGQLFRWNDRAQRRIASRTEELLLEDIRKVG